MTTEDGPGPQLGARLTYLLKNAFRRLEELHHEEMADLDVSGRELGVLLLIEGREPESQQQLAGRLDVDRTTMVAVLDGLEDKGLVGRRPDPADRRRNVVELTDAGRRVLPEAVRASDRAERRLLDDLDRAEQHQLRRLLARTTAGSPDRSGPARSA